MEAYRVVIRLQTKPYLNLGRGQLGIEHSNVSYTPRHGTDEELAEQINNALVSHPDYNIVGVRVDHPELPPPPDQPMLPGTEPLHEFLGKVQHEALPGKPGPISDSDTGWAREAHETYGDL